MASEASDVPKTKKPSDSAFKQQKLPAWQPILTAGTVLPTFFVIGIAFIPVGIALLYFSDEVKEIKIDYTNCNRTFLTDGSPYNWQTTSETCISYIEKTKNDSNAEPCYCRINFTLTEQFQGKVYMYYGLSNFYQNHRRYVKSRDDNQLLGRLGADPSSDCEPFAYVEDGNIKHPVAPCGAIANSMFNDVLSLGMFIGGFQIVPLINTGIAWESDKNIKFKNPPGDLNTAFQNYRRPKAWKKNITELDPNNTDNNGFQNEDFIVWMRTAALPNFRKLYRRVDHSKPTKYFTNGLQSGDYVLIVEYNYDVSSFDGSKSMILSTTSLLGGKNPFLGIAYIVVGCVCLLLGIALLFIHIKCGKSTSEMINVNPRTPYQ